MATEWDFAQPVGGRLQLHTNRAECTRSARAYRIRGRVQTGRCRWHKCLHQGACRSLCHDYIHNSFITGFSMRAMTSKRLAITGYRRGGGFGLLEMIIVFILVVAASAVVFTLYQIAHDRAQAAREADFISAALGNMAATFPSGQYSGAEAYWQAQRNSGAAWTQSPDGWQWGISGYNPITKGDCTTGYCPTMWAKVYFEDGLPVSTGMSDRACHYLLDDLASRFFITGVNDSQLRAGGSPSHTSVSRISLICTHNGPGQLLFLPIILPW